MKKKFRNLLRSLGFFLNSLVIFLVLPVLGWGINDLAFFFSKFQNLLYAIMVAALGTAIAIQGYNIPHSIKGSKGNEEKLIRRQSIVRFSITFLLFAGLFFAPFADRRGIGVMNDNSMLRWIGLACFGMGAALVFWSGVALGKLYSAEVTIQEDHHLVTSGPYHLIRHPRYSGGLLYVFGFALLFRSWIGIIGVVLAIGVFLLRIKDEETLMHEEFGQEWENYCLHSWKLIPFIY